MLEFIFALVAVVAGLVGILAICFATAVITGMLR